MSAIALVKEWSHLPVIADPSHASGRRDLVLPTGAGGVGSGGRRFNGEVHPKPETALSDGPQSLDLSSLIP